MPRLVRDQLEEHEPQLSPFEHSPSAPAAPAATPTFVAEVEMERSPIALPSASTPHGHQPFGETDLEMTARSASLLVPVSHRNLRFRCVLDIS